MTHRSDTSPFDDVKPKFNVSYLHFINGAGGVKKSHCYYTQVQVQMNVTGLKICDLFVWTPNETYKVEAHIDHDFLQSLIPRLQSFYFEFYLPALVSQENTENN